MPEMRFKDRVFSQSEAGPLAGVCPSTLRDWISTCAGNFVSVRQHGRRFYSPQDIVVLRVAGLLVAGGMTTLGAVAAAFEHLQQIPPEDALLYVPNGAVAHTAVSRTPTEGDAIQTIKLGEVAYRTFCACEAVFAGAPPSDAAPRRRTNPRLLAA